MPRLTKKAQIAELRPQYEKAQKLYKRIGKQVLGKPKTAAIRKDYAAAKRHYKGLGRQLGRLTGVA